MKNKWRVVCSSENNDWEVNSYETLTDAIAGLKEADLDEIGCGPHRIQKRSSFDKEKWEDYGSAVNVISTKEPEDAWKQYSDLVSTFTKTNKVRFDIKVTGRAWDRHVELEIGTVNRDYAAPDPRHITWHSTGTRNVSTLRELADAIVAACDFVDNLNPEWASHHDDVYTITYK